MKRGRHPDDKNLIDRKERNSHGIVIRVSLASPVVSVKCDPKDAGRKSFSHRLVFSKCIASRAIYEITNLEGSQVAIS